MKYLTPENKKAEKKGRKVLTNENLKGFENG
jgi:hypothetical protein